MNFFHFLGENHIALGIVSFLSWSLLYFSVFAIISKAQSIKILPMLTQVHIAESFVSCVQGFLCGGVGVLGVLFCKHDVLNSFYEPVVHYCTFGTGYFMYDLVAMYYSNWLALSIKGKPNSFQDTLIYYLKNDGLMIAHHIILTAVLFPALIVYSTMGHFFAGCFFCMELSSPFVNIRIILSKMGLKSSKLYLINGITMTIVFAIVRVFVFPYMYVHYLIQQSFVQNITALDAFRKIPLICHMYSTVILSPQLYWLSMMINGVFSVLAKKPKALDKYD